MGFSITTSPVPDLTLTVAVERRNILFSQGFKALRLHQRFRDRGLTPAAVQDALSGGLAMTKALGLLENHDAASVFLRGISRQDLSYALGTRFLHPQRHIFKTHEGALAAGGKKALGWLLEVRRQYRPQTNGSRGPTLVLITETLMDFIGLNLFGGYYTRHGFETVNAPGEDLPILGVLPFALADDLPDFSSIGDDPRGLDQRFESTFVETRHEAVPEFILRDEGSAPGNDAIPALYEEEEGTVPSQATAQAAGVPLTTNDEKSTAKGSKLIG